jgi:hypothetical protein
MQINNFYSDPVPSVRNPLDSIVLSPHTINANDYGLADHGKDANDYRSILPSICSCTYYDRSPCLPSKSLLHCAQNIFHRLFKCNEFRSDK